jgi:transcription elongation factor GreA
MTSHGLKLLQAELTELKQKERPRVIAAISEARAHGDLKENAEYHAAKEQQSFIEGRIAELEVKVSHAQVIDVTKLPVSDKVVFGATVSLIDVDTDKAIRYQIVGEDEADIKQGKVSITAPLARAIIGKLVGDVIDLQAPSGIISYEITAVEYI